MKEKRSLLCRNNRTAITGYESPGYYTLFSINQDPQRVAGEWQTGKGKKLNSLSPITYHRLYGGVRLRPGEGPALVKINVERVTKGRTG